MYLILRLRNNFQVGDLEFPACGPGFSTSRELSGSGARCRLGLGATLRLPSARMSVFVIVVVMIMVMIVVPVVVAVRPVGEGNGPLHVVPCRHQALLVQDPLQGG